MATIYEVAELAGVSLATVSRVINDSAKVRENTRRKVLAAMEQLEYRPNTIAQSLATNRTNCVGVLVSELHGPIFGTMLSAIESELRASGKFVISSAGHSDESKEREGVEFLVNRNCDALILHLVAVSDDYLRELKQRGVSFIVMNRVVEGIESHCMTLDNERGGYEATRHLLALGHRDIAYVSGPLRWEDAQDRLSGHQRALSEAGIRFDERLLVEGDFHETGGARATWDLLHNGLSFTAMAIGNDEMAAGAMDVLRAQGLSIPGDISVVGFDNVRWARYLFPKLTTINYPVADMGRTAARWVLKHVYAQELDGVRNLFIPELVERASAGPPKG